MSRNTILKVVAIILVAFSPVCFAGQDQQPVRYDNHKLVRTYLTSQSDLDKMLQISQDHWSESVGIGQVDFRVSPEGMVALAETNIRYKVLIDNVQLLVDVERQRLADPLAGGDWYSDYKDYNAVMARLDELETAYPDIAEVLEIGTTIENRAIRGIKITGPGEGKPAFLMNGCQHAREWIAVMVPMYVAENLLSSYDTDPVITDLINSVEFIIIPIVNPDGYVYSWDVNRFWRKNRRHNGGSSFGVDLNRNWDYEWGGEGSSGNPGSQTYRGPSPFSEPESAAMRDYYQSSPNIVANIDFHSYSQLMLQPWGYTPALPPDHDVMDELGEQMASISTSLYGTPYINGTFYTVLYPATGVSIDWTYGAQGVVSYTVELRDQGNFGFVLPPEQIIPNSEEIFPSVLHLAQWVSQEVIGDLDGDDAVSTSDILILLSNWGPCDECGLPGDCPADLDGDCRVSTSDLLMLLSNWG